MNNLSNLTRDEKELLRCFRQLPTESQLDLLGTAEAHCHAFERMKLLGDRQFERYPQESEWH